MSDPTFEELFDLHFPTVTKLKKSYYRRQGRKQAELRMIDLIWEVDIQVNVDKNTTQRDLDAMSYALWQYKHKLAEAIKGENK